MGALYAHPRIRCYVSLTRGEGFGLPTLEAAAAGVPIIATDWSAHTEYLNVGRWTKVPRAIVPVPKARIDGSIFIDGARWAEPDADAYKQRLLKMRDSYRTPKDWAAELSTKLLITHSESAIESAWSTAIAKWL
jgi:glycosyltransferase involved in cell wall biosynthesis